MPNLPTPAPIPEDVYAALWIGALLVAGGAAIDVLPAELSELTEQFFARFRPTAQA